jgi:YD repeat-containing protein
VKSEQVTDVDGVVYTITWDDEGLSADVTSADGRLCLIYAAERDGRFVWFTTESPDVYDGPTRAIMATTAAMRAQRTAGVPAPAQRSPASTQQQSWTALMPAKPQPRRKDWE